MVDEPDAAVSVPVTVQVVLPAPPVATRPAGRLSVKPNVWAPLPEGWPLKEPAGLALQAPVR